MAFRGKTAKFSTGWGGRGSPPDFEQYRDGLHRFLMRRLRSSHHAQDIAQEAYLRLLRVEDAELVRKPQAYLYRIASNLAYELKLREQREPVMFDSEVVEQLAEQSEGPMSDELGARVDVPQQLEYVLKQLPPMYRAVFVLRKRDGLSYAEIAKTLELSVHTVKKYLARAVAQCRAADWGR
jgi:RNA polymerase sigma-70 factor (ECF subfamily)